MELKDFIKPLAYDIAFWMLGLKDPEYPIDQLGNLSLELSYKFRSLAIMILLVKADSEQFYHNLIRSGLTRVTYLARLKQDGIDKDHHLASGRYEPLLDSIAADDFKLASRIADLSPTDWQEGQEYEDDYCYAQILHRFLQEASVEKELQSFLERFEAYLAGQKDARLDICIAIADRNGENFNTAFEALLEQREKKISEDIERAQMEDAEVVAQRQLFVEGLAILRLAKRNGIKIRHEYRYCPSVAQIPMVIPFPNE